MGAAGPVTTSKYSKTTGNCSYSWNNIMDYQTCVVLLVLHFKRFLTVIRALHHSASQAPS